MFNNWRMQALKIFAITNEINFCHSKWPGATKQMKEYLGKFKWQKPMFRKQDIRGENMART